MRNRVKNIYLFLFAAFILFPVFVIIVLSFSSSSYLEFPPRHFSFRWYQSVANDDKWRNAFLLSIKVALSSSFLGTILALLFVLGIRSFPPRIRFLLISLTISPILMPAIVIGVSLFFWYSSLGLAESAISIILSHILISSPVSIWILNSANNSISYDLDKTSQTLGCNPIQTFLFVRLPLLKFNILIALLLCFIISFDEPVISMFVAGTRNVTLPKAMWDGIRYEINPTTLAVSSLIILFTTLIALVNLTLEQKTKQ